MPILLDRVARRRAPAASQQPACFSLVDFGSDSVKAVVVRREKGGVRVLGYGCAPAEGYGLGGGRADLAVLAAITDRALTAAEDQAEANGHGKVVPDEGLFGIPAWLSRGELFSVRQTRADASAPVAAREMKSAWERLERLARERLPLLGDPGAAWKALALTPGVTSLDGHQVSDPTGLKGRELGLSAFGVAVSPAAIGAAEAIARRLQVTLVNLVATPQALASLVPQREAILLDVGAQGTGLQLIHQDALVAAAWWPQGGEHFTQGMARAFRCSSQEAEALKRAYAQGVLSERDRDLVRRALAEPVTLWLEALSARLRPMLAAQASPNPPDAPLHARRAEALPGRMYLTGGGSLLPDLPQALTSLETSRSLSFRQALEIAPLGPRLGVRAVGRPVLFDVPPQPTSDLLAPALGLATCLE